MSTQGSFIIRKDGVDKAMLIMQDAYPDGAGIDVIDLIKTTDLSVLYDCLVSSDEANLPLEGIESFSDEKATFSFGTLRRAVKERKRLWISREGRGSIRNSLFCEYGYVVDLDQDRLMFFKGRQTKPQKDNPFGQNAVQLSGMHKPYYPCRLAAVFPIEYIRKANIQFLALEMAKAGVNEEDIIVYHVNELDREDCKAEDYSGQIAMMMKELLSIENVLKKLQTELPEITLLNWRRMLELTGKCADLKKAAAGMAEQIEIMI